jgi:hypothetical protein
LVTILSVLYRNRPIFELNHCLTQALNIGTAYRWLVADNELGGNSESGRDGITIVDGVERTSTRDKGSLHHARALQKCLARVDTRFVLSMDPDFFVVQQHWLERIVAHATKHDIAFFGAGWHPRWSYQYRDFPAVHFMLIDLEKVPADSINFLPLIDQDLVWHLMNSNASPIPGWLRETLKIGRIRDTGWQIFRKYFDNPSFRHEVLTPSFRPPDTVRVRLERRLGSRLPDRLRLIPRHPGAFTDESFLEEICPIAWKRGWEEFFWHGKPFAFHLRTVGRAASSESEASLARGVLKNLGLA